MSDQEDTGPNWRQDAEKTSKSFALSEEANQKLNKICRDYGFSNECEALEHLIRGYDFDLPWLGSIDTGAHENCLTLDKAPHVMALVKANRVDDSVSYGSDQWAYELVLNGEYIGSIRPSNGDQGVPPRQPHWMWSIRPAEWHLSSRCNTRENFGGSIADVLLDLLAQYDSLNR